MEKHQDNRKRKEAVRKEFLRRRNAVTGQTRQTAEYEIQAGLLEGKALQAANTVFLYASVSGEVSTQKLIKELLDAGRQVALPKVEGENMNFYLIESVKELLPGYAGILEPAASAERLRYPTEQDVMLLPGVAFDREGNRLGYGKGYYDRYLSYIANRGGGMPCSIGICFACQIEEDRLPIQEGDRQVNAVITEAGVLDCRVSKTEKPKGI